MFICIDCIKDFVISVPLESCLRSRGICENCRKFKVCYDIPHNRYYHIRSIYAKELKERKGHFNPSER